MSFKFKLLAFSLATITVSIAVGVLANRTLTKVIASYTKIVEHTAPQTTAVAELYSEIRNYRLYLRTLQGTPQAKAEAVIEKIAQVEKDYEKAAEKCAGFGLDGEHKAEFEKANENWEKFKVFGAKVIELYKAGDQDGLDKHFSTESAIATSYREAIKKLISLNEEELQSGVAEAKKSASDGTTLNVLVIAICSCLSLFLGVFFATTVSKTLTQISSQLFSGAEQISKTSKEVAQSSIDLSAATTEQAASLQETVASVDEINSMIQRNSDNAESSREIAAKSNSAATKGQEVVTSMISAMDHIHASATEIVTQTEASNQEIAQIINVISEIENKTKVINEIVFQTKLLSFNASVEAARAGEHGKGFAVVAEEVGNLAQMSGNAAKEISQLLSGSVQRVNDIVNSSKSKIEAIVGTSQEKVKLGMDTAQSCGEVLVEIVECVSDLSSRIDEISTASKEQSNGVREISSAMAQLDQVTQQNSSAANNASVTGKALDLQAEKIRELIGTLTDIVQGQGASTTLTHHEEAPVAIKSSPQVTAKAKPAVSKKPVVKTKSAPKVKTSSHSEDIPKSDAFEGSDDFKLVS